MRTHGALRTQIHLASGEVLVRRSARYAELLGAPLRSLPACAPGVQSCLTGNIDESPFAVHSLYFIRAHSRDSRVKTSAKSPQRLFCLAARKERTFVCWEAAGASAGYVIVARTVWMLFA